VSPRLITILAVLGITAFGIGAGRWIVQPYAASLSGVGEAVLKAISDADRREHREKFFDGDSNRDIRGGQEMKPRW
jgi:type IV secretion system protein TrbK